MANDHPSYSKGWTGPKVVDGLQIEGSFRAHQVPITMEKPEHLELLNEWLESYRPQELFDKNGRLIPELAELAPKEMHVSVPTHMQMADFF